MRCWERLVPLFTQLGCLGRAPSLSISHCIPIQHISLLAEDVLSISLQQPFLFQVCTKSVSLFHLPQHDPYSCCACEPKGKWLPLRC